jgi:hypothetical protein
MEALSQKLQQGIVGCGIDGRRSDFDPQLISKRLTDFI